MKKNCVRIKYHIIELFDKVFFFLASWCRCLDGVHRCIATIFKAFANK